MAENNTPKNADFVQRIVGDANNPPQTRTLSGWFGDSGKEGFRRLYTDAQLNNYVDIPNDAILHTEPIKDSQPAGAVIVWIKADAQVDSSSASSRASRFLQGDLTKELLGEGAQERGGFRCVTQPPCAEPTGFTGLCTKQPDVGGCWPCITAIPHCAEPTGFTGKCTHVPWPLPTRYAHCTVLHCPTFDLTCIPQICNVVASGIPGCGGGSPIEQGGGPQQQQVGADAEAARIPKTELLGCGFTKEWGLCNTQLLHCIPSVNNPCITTTETGPRCQTRTVDVEAFRQGGAAGAAAGGGGAGIQQQSFFQQCPTRESFCTLFGPICPSQELQCTFFGPQCPPTPGIICTQFNTCGVLSAPPRCPNPSAIDLCPTRFRCPPRTAPDFGGGVNQAAFGAAPAAVVPPPIFITGLNCPSAVDACPSHGCTAPITSLFGCTQDAKVCPTGCGPDCQTKQFECTQHFGCTQLTPGCPSFGFECSAMCPTQPAQGCPTPGVDCTVFCPSQELQCPTSGPVACQTLSDPICNINQAQAFGAAPAAQAQIAPTLTPTCRSAIDACPTRFNCPSPLPQFCPSPIPLRCPSGVIACPSPLPFRCPSPGPICPPSPLFRCPSPFCPPSPFQCPTGIVCQASPIPQCGGGVSFGACPSIACQPGGGGVQQQFGAAQAQRIGFTNFDCPTPNTFCFVCPPDQFQVQRNAALFPNPTPATRCFVCDPVALQAPGGAAAQRVGITFFFNCPTPATFCFICPPITFDFSCQFRAF